MGKAVFDIDEFLDKFLGNETILQNYFISYDGQIKFDTGQSIKSLKTLFADSNHDETITRLTSDLYRVQELCTTAGHDDLIAVCRESEYHPDPEENLSVECVCLKVRTEQQELFERARDRNFLRDPKSSVIHRGKASKSIENLDDALKKFEKKIKSSFKDEKNSLDVLVRCHSEKNDIYFLVNHENRTKSELVMKRDEGEHKIAPLFFRPVQTDVVHFNQATGQLAIQSRTKSSQKILRKCFAESCLNDPDFFEEDYAVKKFNLMKIAEKDFSLSLKDGDQATMTAIKYVLPQKYSPIFEVKSKNVLETLKANGIRQKFTTYLESIENNESFKIKSASIKIKLDGERYGRTLHLTGSNSIKLKRSASNDKIYDYLKRWGLLYA